MKPKSVAEHVARNVRTVRQMRGLSLDALSQELEAFGHHLSPTTLSKIENGGRGIDVDDLVALALTLHVPPARLLADPGMLDDVEIRDVLDRWLSAWDRRAAAVAPLEAELESCAAEIWERTADPRMHAVAEEVVQRWIDQRESDDPVLAFRAVNLLRSTDPEGE